MLYVMLGGGGQGVEKLVEPPHNKKHSTHLFTNPPTPGIAPPKTKHNGH
jgi:hypothetical protein